MKVSVIIPTLNAERWISKQLDMLLSQTVEAEILVIDSGSTDCTVSIVASYGDRICLLQIPRDSFDHGGTRDFALHQSTGDYVLFITQDAMPTDQYCIEKLLYAFSSPDIAAVYGKQIARPDAPEYERLIRLFNYPDQPRTWRGADIPRYGVKSYFFSNVFAAYRRVALPPLHGPHALSGAQQRGHDDGGKAAPYGLCIGLHTGGEGVPFSPLYTPGGVAAQHPHRKSNGAVPGSAHRCVRR